MVEIQNDTLQISFPEISTEIERLLDEHIRQVLPSFINDDREKATDQYLLRNGLLNKPDDCKEVIRQLLLGLSPEDIAKQLKKLGLQKAMGRIGEKVGSMEIGFQRTLRIPDDGKTYNLPPGLGRFPLRHAEDFADKIPAQWLERGGVMMPMYQSEALWLNFRSNYHFLLKVAAGKINAISGEPWREGFNRAQQDYVVIPKQPWLDGFAISKGMIRQFVAMPLGSGYSVEEQVSGKAEFGGIQFQAVPIKASIYFKAILQPQLPKQLSEIIDDLIPDWCKHRRVLCCMAPIPSSMGVGGGGLMRQQIYKDRYKSEIWDTAQSSRCFVHLCDTLSWRKITGENPPQKPITAKEYKRAGLPWFDYYRDDLAVFDGSKTLADIQSVNAISLSKNKLGLIDNDSVDAPLVIDCGPKQKKFNN